MSRAERLIELMITINAKRSFTAGELAEEFSVSKRTILRDLQVLESIGFPLIQKLERLVDIMYLKSVYFHRLHFQKVR